MDNLSSKYIHTIFIVILIFLSLFSSFFNLHYNNIYYSDTLSANLNSDKYFDEELFESTQCNTDSTLLSNSFDSEVPITILSQKNFNASNLSFNLEIISAVHLKDYYIINSLIEKKSQLYELQCSPNIISISSNTLNEDNYMRTNKISSYEDNQSDESLSDFLGLDYIHNTLNITGDDITISIHDTGVDFGMPDLINTIKVDNNNIPSSFDPTGNGIGLLPVTLGNEKIYSQNSNTQNSNTYIDVKNENPDIWIGSSFTVFQSRDFISSWNNFNVTGINSLSNTYHFGILALGNYINGNLDRELPLQFFFCLTTDSSTPGVYDTLYIDFESSYNKSAELWNSYVNLPVQISADYDFTNNEPHQFNNSFILTKDFVNDVGSSLETDGIPDISAGSLSYVFDRFGLGNTYNFSSNIINGIDTSGKCIGIMAPSTSWHGSVVARTIAGQNTTGWTIWDNYNTYQHIENDSVQYFPGIAPDAKLMAITGIDLISDIDGWLWCSGYDLNSTNWYEYTGNHISHIDINSWGLDITTYQNNFVGFDILNLVIELLTIPEYVDINYPGKLFIGSAGNSGNALGTINSPSTSPTMLTVGGSTLISKITKNYGEGSTSGDQLWSFSSNGPTPIGYSKPDILAPASNSFSPFPIQFGLFIGTNAWGIWSGTSLSTAIVGAASALVLNSNPNLKPSQLKNIITSTADDIGLSSLTQGSGRLNLINSIQLANGNYSDSFTNKSLFLSYNNDSFNNYKDLKGNNYNFTPINKGNALNNYNFSEHNYYQGYVLSGSSYQGELTINGLAQANRNVEYLTEEVISLGTYDYYTNGVYTSINITDILNETDKDLTIRRLIMKVTLDYDEFFSRFESGLRTIQAFTFDWYDTIKNGQLDFYQLNPISYDRIKPLSDSLITSNYFEIELAFPGKNVNNTLLLGLYDALFTSRGTWGFSLEIEAIYTKTWDIFNIEDENDQSILFSTDIQENSSLGCHFGFINISSNNCYYLIPYSFTVIEELKLGPNQNTFTCSINDWETPNLDVENGKRMSGRWETITVNLTDKTAKSLTSKIKWENSSTSIDIYIVNPSGQLINKSVDNYQQGGIYNSTNTGDLQNYIISTVNEIGYYRIILHLTHKASIFNENIILELSYITQEIFTDVEIVTEGTKDGGILYGPHAKIGVYWDEINLDQLPGLNIESVTLSILSGFELYFSGIITQNESIPSYSIEEWIEVDLLAGEIVSLTGYFETEDFDFYVFAPSSIYGPTNLPESQTQALANDLLKGTMVETVNPEKGSFITQENGTYKIGIDSFTGYGKYTLLLSTLVGISQNAEGDNISPLDTQILEKNGQFIVESTVTTNSNIKFTKRFDIEIINFFSPEIKLISPNQGDKFFNELNPRLRDNISCSWITADLNSQDETITNEISISYDNGLHWYTFETQILGIGKFTFDFDGTNLGLPYNNTYLFKITVWDNSSYTFSQEALSGVFIITRRTGLQISYPNFIEIFIFLITACFIKKNRKHGLHLL